MAQSYYQPREKKPSLFDRALQTAAGAIAGQMVGDFFETVPPELQFASSLHKAQITTMEAGETDGLSELKSVINWIDNLPDIARVDTLTPDSTELKDSYAGIYKALNRLSSDENISYYDISKTDPETGKPLVVSGFSQPLKYHAELVAQRFKNAQTVFDHINATHQGYQDLRTGTKAIKENLQTGPGGKISIDQTPYQKDATQLNQIIDDISNLYSMNNIVIGGKSTIGGVALERTIDEATDWARANRKAHQLDFDPTTPGIQVAKEMMSLSKLDLKAFGGLEKDIVNDLIANNFLTGLEGQGEVSYEQGAIMIQKYFDANEPKKAIAIMDRMLPRGPRLKAKKEIAAMLKAQKALDLASATKLQVILSKQVAYSESGIKFFEKEALEKANALGIQSRQLNDKLFGDVSSSFGGTQKGFGVDQTERTRMLGLVNTKEWRVPDALREFVQITVPFLSDYNTDTKMTGTTKNPYLIQAKFYRNRQRSSAKKLLTALAWTNPIGQVIEDINGKVWKWDEITGMDEQTAYATLKKNRTQGGLLYLLGLGVSDKLDMTDIERAALVDTRANALVTVEPGTEGMFKAGSPKKSAYMDEVLDGAEGRVLVSMAKHWVIHETLLDEVASPEIIKKWQDESLKIDFMKKVLSGFYGDNNLMNEEQKVFIQDFIDGKNLSDGDATINNNTGTVTSKIKEFGKEANLEAVRRSILAQQVDPAIREVEMDVALNELNAQIDPTIREGAMDIALNQFNAEGISVRTPTSLEIVDELVPPKEVSPVTEAISTVAGEAAVKQLVSAVGKKGSKEVPPEAPEMDWDEDLGSADAMGEKLTNNKVLMSSLSSLGKNIEVGSALKNLELQSVVLTKREKMEFKSTRKGVGRYGSLMTSAERGQFSKDGVVPQRLMSVYNRDKTLSYAKELTGDLKEIEKLKNSLVKYKSRVDEQSEFEGERYAYTEKTIQAARKSVKMVSSKIQRLENEIKSSLGKSIDPTTGLLSDESTNKAIYDLLARAFPNKSIEELQQMMIQYSTLATEDYALTK